MKYTFGPLGSNVKSWWPQRIRTYKDYVEPEVSHVFRRVVIAFKHVVASKFRLKSNDN